MSNLFYSLGNPYILEEEHFARLLDYYQRDSERVVTYQPVGLCGFESTDVQIYSLEWDGIPEEEFFEQIE